MQIKATSYHLSPKNWHFIITIIIFGVSKGMEVWVFVLSWWKHKVVELFRWQFHFPHLSPSCVPFDPPILLGEIRPEKIISYTAVDCSVF